MLRPLAITSIAIVLLACGSDVVTVSGGSSGSASSGSTTADAPASTSTGPGTSTSTSNADETTAEPFGGFVDDDLDAGSSWAECDIFAQDCPAGLKCMPYAADGGSAWNALGCFPIAEDPAQPGEPCTVDGNGASGIDTCALGSMCWDVDPRTNEGWCVAFCVGDYDDPYCEEPHYGCSIVSDGIPVLCLPTCHPLQDDCAGGQGCYPVLEGFQCVPDASEEMGAVGDPCEYINVCDPTTFCADAKAVPECAGPIGCCSSFCTVGDDSPCLPGQTCQPWYEPSEVPIGYDGLGGCALP